MESLQFSCNAALITQENRSARCWNRCASYFLYLKNISPISLFLYTEPPSSFLPLVSFQNLNACSFQITDFFCQVQGVCTSKAKFININYDLTHNFSYHYFMHACSFLQLLFYFYESLFSFHAFYVYSVIPFVVMPCKFCMTDSLNSFYLELYCQNTSSSELLFVYSYNYVKILCIRIHLL